MKKTLNLYSSSTNDTGLQGFLLAISQNIGCEVKLLPLTLLPRPDPQRRQALRVERAELLSSIQLAGFSLEQYATGAWQPDAGHENGLRFDLEALHNRLRAVQTVLGTEAGGADNA